MEGQRGDGAVGGNNSDFWSRQGIWRDKQNVAAQRIAGEGKKFKEKEEKEKSVQGTDWGSRQRGMGVLSEIDDGIWATVAEVLMRAPDGDGWNPRGEEQG